MVRNQRDEYYNSTTWTHANFVEDYTVDCNTATTTGDGFATYMRDLAALGQLDCTVTA